MTIKAWRNQSEVQPSVVHTALIQGNISRPWRNWSLKRMFKWPSRGPVVKPVHTFVQCLLVVGYSTSFILFSIYGSSRCLKSWLICFNDELVRNEIYVRCYYWDRFNRWRKFRTNGTSELKHEHTRNKGTSSAVHFELHNAYTMRFTDQEPEVWRELMGVNKTGKVNCHSLSEPEKNFRTLQRNPPFQMGAIIMYFTVMSLIMVRIWAARHLRV